MPSKKLAIGRQQADLVSDIYDIYILQGTELLCVFSWEGNVRLLMDVHRI
jgi:hypothetical protein